VTAVARRATVPAAALLILRLNARPRSAQQSQHQDLNVLLVARVDFV